MDDAYERPSNVAMDVNVDVGTPPMREASFGFNSPGYWDVDSGMDV